MGFTDELSRLADLRDKGVMTTAEFERQKQIILARAAAPQSTIGAYDIFELVGEGGMGRVYRARHRTAAMATRQGGDVAIKVLHAQLAGRAGFVERFRQEATALDALHHPNIVKVFDVIEDASQIAIVMEWVPGQPLSELIGLVTGPMPWEKAWSYVDPLLDAVQHAHDRTVIHRDLKPDNIRVTPDGKVKVLDFGIARIGDAPRRTRTGTGMGTVAYMAPEQYTGAKTVDERADVYSLGMTLYEIVAGRLPWSPAELDQEFTVLQQKQQGKIRPPTDFYPAIPPWVVEAIQNAVNPDPGLRPATVAALRAALKGEASPTPVLAPVESIPDTVPLPMPIASPPPVPWVPLVAVFGAVLLVMVTVLAYLALVPVRIRLVAEGATATPDEPVHMETLGISTFGLQRQVDALLSASPVDRVRFSGDEVFAIGSGTVSVTAEYGSLRSTTEIYASTPVAIELELDGKRVDGTVQLVRGRPVPLVVRLVDGEGQRGPALEASALSLARSNEGAVSITSADHQGRTVPVLQAESDGRSTLEVQAKGLSAALQVWSRVPARLALRREILVPKDGTVPIDAALYDADGDAIGDPLPDRELTVEISDGSIVTFSATDPAGLTWRGAGTTSATFSWGPLRTTTTLRSLNDTETLAITCVGPPIDPAACTTVGGRYADGFDEERIAKNSAAAARYLGLACRNAYTSCSNASYYTEMAGDMCGAKELAEIGCNRGDAHACGNLGTHYGNAGKCAALDYEVASALYRQACNAGNDWFCGNLYILVKSNRATLVGSETLENLQQRGCVNAKNTKACP